jgi:hypothetical protein
MAEVAQADATRVALAATEFGGQAAALGLGDETAAAAFLAIERVSKNEDTAATQLRSLLDQVDKKGLSKGSLPATINAIQARIASGETAFDVLGETRAVQGFRNLRKELPFFQQQEQLLQRANVQDLAAQRGGRLLSDPVFAAGVARQQAEGLQAIAEEQRHAVRENLFDAARASRRAALTRSGRMGGAGQVEMLAWAAADVLGLERPVLREQMFQERMGRNNFSPELERQLGDFLGRQTQALESIDKKTPVPRTVPVPGGRQE